MTAAPCRRLNLLEELAAECKAAGAPAAVAKVGFGQTRRANGAVGWPVLPTMRISVSPKHGS